MTKTSLLNKIDENTDVGSLPPEAEEDEGDDDNEEKEKIILVGVEENDIDTQKRLFEEYKTLDILSLENLLAGFKSKSVTPEQVKEFKNMMIKSVVFDDREKYNLAVVATPCPVTYLGNSYQLTDFRYLFVDGRNNLHRRAFDLGYISQIGDSWYSFFLRDIKKTGQREIKSPEALYKIVSRAFVASIKDEFPDEDLEDVDATNVLNQIFGIELSERPLIFVQKFSGNKVIMADDTDFGACFDESMLVDDAIRETVEQRRKDSFNAGASRHNLNSLFKEYESEFSKFVNIKQTPEKFQNYGIMGWDGNELK